MISVTPQGSIYLCKTPLINDYKNQLTFSNLTSQLNYFNSRIQKTFDNYTYIKKDNVIKVGENIDNIIGCNYLFYRNNGFSNKYYFCFIVNMEYINENCTAITIETDVFQTYQFNINYKPCFVEREHVNDDTIGLHTIDENLNVGEVIEEDEYNDAAYTNEYDYYICVSSAWQIKDNSHPDDAKKDLGTQYSSVAMYNNTIFGNMFFFFKIRKNHIEDLLNLTSFIIRTNSDGHIADITDIFIVPSMAIIEGEATLHTAFVTETQAFHWYTIPFSDDIKTLNTNIVKRHSFTGFTPKNNKCFVYPYNYLYVSNNQGSYNIYKYEDFTGQYASFQNQFAITIGGSGRLVPTNYKGMLINEDEAIPLGKYPTCGWSADSFTNWLTQNSVNLATQFALGVGSLALGVATSGASVPVGLALSSLATGNSAGNLNREQFNSVATNSSIALNTAGQIGDIIGQFYQASLLPNIQGSQPTGDVIWGANANCFMFRRMRAKNEYLQAIDDYFSSFGYKVNVVKIPNITGRTNWNYVKTLDCNFTGSNIPQQDLNVIRTMFNNGVTLWHNSATMLDYSQSNAIVV